MRRSILFVVALFALLGLSAVACSSGGDIVSPSPVPNTPTTTSVVPVLPITLDNGSALTNGAVIPYTSFIHVTLTYGLAGADTVWTSTAQVSVCVGGTIEGTVLIASCQTRGYKPIGRDTFDVTMTSVSPAHRPGVTTKLWYFISKKLPNLGESQPTPVPPDSGNIRITDVFDNLWIDEYDVLINWRN